MLWRFNVSSKRDFILQQGLGASCSVESAPLVFSALQFQPKILAGLVALGALLQSAGMFLALGVLLWWSALAPRWNPFEALYNATRRVRRGICLMPAAPPRLFAQALAGSIALSIAAMLILNERTPAILLEVLLLIAIAAILFARFCFGAFLFNRLSRRFAISPRRAHS